MKYIYSVLPAALGFLASVSAQGSSSTLVVPGPMEQSVTALSGTRTDETSSMTMTSMTMTSMTMTSSTSSASSGSQASQASSDIVNAGNLGGTPAGATTTTTSLSAGDPGNVSQTGVSAAQNTGNAMVVGGKQAILVGLGVGAAVFV